MKRILVVVCLIGLGGTLEMVGQSDRDVRADSIFRVAVALIDDAQYDEAFGILEEANENFPEFSAFTFEQGYVRMLQRRYKESAMIFESILDSPDANGRYYSMLGNAYDLAGDSENAVATYVKGLERFPNAGEIYVELGTMRAKAEEYQAAAETWEQGIAADPDYPSNYFRAAQMYLPTAYRGWGILYGEMFVLLELNSERSYQMRDMLHRAYDEAYSYEPGEDSTEYSFNIEFFGDGLSVLSTDSGLFAPYATFCATALFSPAIGLNIEDRPSVAWLHEQRTGFLQAWYDNEEVAAFYDVSLYAYHRRMVDAGLFEAYNHMLLACESTREEVENWVTAHPEEIERLGAWLAENPYDAERNPFSRPTLGIFPFDPESAGPSVQLEPAE